MRSVARIARSGADNARIYTWIRQPWHFVGGYIDRRSGVAEFLRRGQYLIADLVCYVIIGRAVTNFRKEDRQGRPQSPIDGSGASRESPTPPWEALSSTTTKRFSLSWSQFPRRLSSRKHQSKISDRLSAPFHDLLLVRMVLQAPTHGNRHDQDDDLARGRHHTGHLG